MFLAAKNGVRASRPLRRRSCQTSTTTVFELPAPAKAIVISNRRPQMHYAQPKRMRRFRAGVVRVWPAGSGRPKLAGQRSRCGYIASSERRPFITAPLDGPQVSPAIKIGIMVIFSQHTAASVSPFC